MSLFVEFHLIQNFAPSNLNRDDTGAPKDAFFGGHRRARVSSQCFKRAIRLSANEHGLIDPQFQGVRTQKLFKLLTDGRIRVCRSSCGISSDRRIISAICSMS